MLLNSIKLTLTIEKVSYLDFSCLYSRLKRSNVFKLKHDETAHEKKLEALGIPINNTVISDKTVINLSNSTLTASELDVLSLGLSYSLPKFKINFAEHYFAFENLVNTLKYLPYKPMNWDSLKTDIATVAHSSFREFNTFKHSFMKLPPALYDALIKLRTDDPIIITKPDKGRGTVVMNKGDYLMKVEDILNDLSKFK